MPKISNIELIYQNEQHVLSIRKRTGVAQLPMLIGESYGAIAQYLSDMGELMSDVPFVAYYNMDMHDLDVDIGFPVSSAFPGKGDIKHNVIPEGKFVFALHLGSYTELEPLYAEMAAWITNNGLTPSGPAYEFYYNGPEFPESQYLTKVVMPVK